MKPSAGLAILAVAAFVVFAAATAPARVIFDAAAEPAGLRAAMVQGTVWDAQIVRLSAGGPPVADVRARLRPASLITGAARFDIEARDPSLRGQGVLALSLAGAALEEVEGVAALSRLSLPVSLPDGQSARVEIDELALDRNGRCRAAEGRVMTTGLSASGEAFGADLPALEGVFLCAGDAVALDVSGRSASLAVSGRIRFEHAGPVWRLEARSTDRDVIAAVSMLGFSQTGPGVFELDSRTLQEES